MWVGNAATVLIGSIAPRTLLFALVLVLSACGVTIERDGVGRVVPSSGSLADAVPRAEPKSKYGNPKSYAVFGERYYPLKSSTGYQQRGIASWYGKKFHGRRTSNGETYDMYAMTAAHKTLPLPTYVAVTNLDNGRRAVLRVNDRGPFHDNRIIDLSYAAATKLDIVRSGTGLVEVVAIDTTLTQPQGQANVVVASVTRRVKLYLQAGSFSIRANAARLQERLRLVSGELVKITDALVNGDRVYRVRIGPLVDVTHADRLVQILMATGIGSTHIVLE